MDKVKQAEEECEDWEGRAGAALGSAVRMLFRIESWYIE